MSRLQVTDCIEEHSCIITHLKFMSTACSEVWASGSITDPFRYPPDDVAWLRTWQGLRGFKHREIIKPESYRIFTYQFTLRDIEIIWNYIYKVHAWASIIQSWRLTLSPSLFGTFSPTRIPIQSWILEISTILDCRWNHANRLSHRTSFDNVSSCHIACFGAIPRPNIWHVLSTCFGLYLDLFDGNTRHSHWNKLSRSPLWPWLT